MIAVRLEGRLGNQLFQYAFAYSAATDLNTTFYLDKSIEDFIPGKYFDLKTERFKNFDSWVFRIRGYKNLFSFHIKRGFYKLLQVLFLAPKSIIISNDEQPTTALGQVVNGYMYWGFFQSEQYFVEQISNVRDLFTIKSEFIEQYKSAVIKPVSNRKLVAIHIRRGDYGNLGLTLPMNYYRKAIAHVIADDVDFMFISDDIKFVEQEFADLPNKQISNNNEIVDLQILMNADICILANSSFSWWGAWLNNKSDKVIYAPKYFLGAATKQEYPPNIYPAGWNLIEPDER
jgi:hypothetical protein